MLLLLLHTHNPSRVWRKLLKNCYIKVTVGNGLTTSLWYDNWHPLGLPKNLVIIIHDSSLLADSIVSSWIIFGPFPSLKTVGLNEVRKVCPPFWIPLLFNQINVYGLSLLMDSSQFPPFGISWRFTFLIVSWSKVVRFPSHVPKCSLITLSTADGLVLFGIIPTSCCSFCNEHGSHDHIFFDCPFSSQVWGIIFSWQAQPLSHWITLLSAFKGRTLRVTTIKLAFTITLYHSIWLERNARKSQCPVKWNPQWDFISYFTRSLRFFLGKYCNM